MAAGGAGGALYVFRTQDGELQVTLGGAASGAGTATDTGAGAGAGAASGAGAGAGDAFFAAHAAPVSALAWGRAGLASADHTGRVVLWH